MKRRAAEIEPAVGGAIMEILKSSLTEKLLSERRYQFWALNVFGWLGYGFFVALSALLWDISVDLQITYTAMSAGSGLLLSLLLRKYLHRVWLQAPILRGFKVLLAVCLITAAWSWLKMDVFFILFDDKAKHKGPYEFLSWFTYSFFILLSWTGLYFGIKYYQMLQVEKDKTHRARAMAQEAQLKMLRYQLNPHFLFNTLNAISTLVLERETVTANAMVTGLSKFLRYSLDNDPMQKVSLNQEVSAMQLYLDIEKMRFENRLLVDIQVSEPAGGALVPSLLLQPLVENALKYAVATSEDGGGISLSAQVLAGRLLLELVDTGPGMPLAGDKPMPGNGVGLINTRERLQAIYGTDYTLKFDNLNPHGLKISLLIPFELHSQKTQH